MTTITATVRSPKRWALVALAVLGAGLIAAPAIFQMWDRAPKGATMIDEFAPYMHTARLDGYQREIAEIDAAVREGTAHRLDARSAGFATFRDQWEPIHADMSDLLDRIQGNLGNYLAVKALPKFSLFPWFFVIPGALILLAAGAALALGPGAWLRLRWVLAALGAGLILAPAVFQMFDRAPKGGHMMTAFKTIETRKKVETIQGYFGSIAVGQGSLRLDVVPALRRSGLTADQVATRYPAITRFDDDWTAILNDLTPMIGTMSDNVDNYQAVKALPPFPLFPWFFVAPGLIAIALAFAAGPRTTRALSSSPQPESAT